jgi:hypothetical protein
MKALISIVSPHFSHASGSSSKTSFIKEAKREGGFSSCSGSWVGSANGLDIGAVKPGIEPRVLEA